MFSDPVDEPVSMISAGFRAIPISRRESESALRICVLVRPEPDPSSGRLVLLRSGLDTFVYLGCLLDGHDTVHDWVEVWVQNIADFGLGLPALKDAVTNHGLDQRWSEQAKALRDLDPGVCIVTGAETVHPLPTYLDAEKGCPMHPGDAHGSWELCREDELLKAAGLPPYNISLFRYLHQSSRGSQTSFIPVTPGAPESAATTTLAEACPTLTEAVPLNPQGGLMMIRRLAPLAFEEYVDLLGGKVWKGLEPGATVVQLHGAYPTLADATRLGHLDTHLFLGRQGREARLVETLHLKIQAVREVIRLARDFVRRRQLPFLNLSSDSFRFQLGELSGGLPAFWGSKCLLVQPSSAFALPIRTSEFRYFLPASLDGPAVYRSSSLVGRNHSYGSCRLRRVVTESNGETVAEGTVVLEDRPLVSLNDLLWVRLPLASGRVDLYGHLYSSEGLAHGEARFRTIPQQLAPENASDLQAAQGLSFPRTRVEWIPLLSTPCDLFAIGVLAVRALLVNAENSLPVALDETLSLARQVAADADPARDLKARVRGLFEKDPRWQESIGSHRIIQSPADGKVSTEAIPADLWFEILAALVRLFPGIGPDSICRDLGDAPPLALEKVFDPALGDWENLLTQTRSLIVVDWRFNRQVHSVIQSLLGAV